MTAGFVWFHNGSDKPAESAAFYRELLGWSASDGPGDMTMLGAGGQPFAGISSRAKATGGWVPYAQVDELDAATKRAVKLGAEVVQPRTKGPAGDFTIVRDPGGATVALWQKA